MGQGPAGPPTAASAAQAALSLSAAVAEGRTGANILLLDAFILVLVLYRAGAPPDLPFPPPQNSALWRAITEIKRVGVVRPALLGLHGAVQTVLFN